ncbi:hypothetical protein NN561_005949 [Cricetulus griseus]
MVKSDSDPSNMSEKRHTEHVVTQRLPESFRGESLVPGIAALSPPWLPSPQPAARTPLTAGSPKGASPCTVCTSQSRGLLLYPWFLGLVDDAFRVPGCNLHHSQEGAPWAVACLFFILPCTDSFIKVDMRTISFDIPPQEVLTKDSVTISVDGVVYYRVQNATLAVANITNADSATRLLAQTTLRNALGTKNLSQILSDREEIAHHMQSTLDDATDDWGIKVERVEIKDVKLPVQLQRAMAAEAEAAREARAKGLFPSYCFFFFLLPQFSF